MQHSRVFKAVASAVAIGVAGFGLASSAFAQSGDALTARAGNGTVGYSVDAFLPADLTVKAGTTVTWEFPWLEPHSVTYGTPTGDPTAPSTPGETVVELNAATTYFSSGLLTSEMTPAPTYSIKFATAGEYEIYCAIHPLMKSDVTVVASGDVDTQDEVDARGDAEYDAALASLVAIADGLKAQPVAVTARPDGTKKYSAQIGAENQSGVAMQFFPSALQLMVGDTLEFLNPGFTPHTASFGQYPGGDPFALPVSDNSAAWDGTGFYHSGILGQDWPGGPSFEITFSKAGTYNFYCALHGNQGQAGQVVVAAAPVPTPTVPAPRPPATGSGTAESTAAAWFPAAVAGVLLVAAGAGILGFRRIRQ